MLLKLLHNQATTRLSSLWLNSSCRVPRLASVARRCTHQDATKAMSGEREVVGYGMNGSPVYIDCADFPFPAIRFREPTAEVNALREKELDDWKKLSLKEKKQLYRYSFCQTYAEFQYFTPEWKLAVGIGLWASAIAIMVTFTYFCHLYDPLPESYNEENRKAQLRRIIQCEIQPITGLSSGWDYEKNKWK